ncbi:MAG: ATP-binding protein, partial [Acidobacteriota bacterium]|nr:ATP-binding protein [Acidobacteriota bacterium]
MTGTSARPHENRSDFRAGGGDAGELMRNIDWARTPLGPAQSWPHSLRTSVSTCLNSRFPILLWWGPEMVMLYNDAYSPLIGIKHPDAMGMVGKQCWPEIWHVIGPMLAGVLERGEATRADDLLLLLERHGYREECYFTFSYSPIRDESGGVGGVFTPVHETTERVVGERRLRTLRELGAQPGAGSVGEACEKAAKILAANPSDLPFVCLYLFGEDRRSATLCGVAGISGGTPASLESISLAGETTPKLFQAALSANTELIDLDGADSQEAFKLLPGGAWGVPPSELAVVPLAVPGQSSTTGFLVIGLNPRRRFDRDYRAFVELVARQAAISIAGVRALEEERKRADALAELDRAKTAFFANVSHELRTPLALMLGPLEDLRRDLPDAEARDTLLSLVYRNGLRLQKLVNTLLDFSRIEAGRAKAMREPTDLAAFTIGLASNFRSAFEKAAIRFSVVCDSLDRPARVDREMWEKIVLNLLSNAFKFTFEGEVVVRLRQAGANAELSVRDTGIGIPENALPLVFSRFHRVEGAMGRTQEGTGIGLALVQELVKLHGGTVQVKSEAGRGSEFTVVLPLPVAHARGSEFCQSLPSRDREGAVAFVEEALSWIPEPATDVPPATSAPR